MKYAALSCGCQVWNTWSKDEGNILIKYEVEINLHNTMHGVIKLNKSVMGTGFTKYLSYAIDEERLVLAVSVILNLSFFLQLSFLPKLGI